MVPPEVSAVSRAPRRPRSCVIDRVVVDERAAPAAPAGVALGQHRQHRGEILARERAIGPGAAEAGEERVLAPFARGDFGDDLLRQDVERLLGEREAIELAAADAVEQRCAFDELVARQREEAAFGRAVDGVAGAADALQEARDRTRRAELADEIDVADVDAELERGGGDERLKLAVLQPLLGLESQLLGEAAVMRAHMLGAETVGELARGALGHAPRVDEDERGAMRLDELGEAGVDLLPDLARHHRLERRQRHLDLQIAGAAMAGVDDAASGRGSALGAGADEEMRHLLDRLLRCREADAEQRVAAKRGEALQREREMRAALVGRHRMDLVDDHRARRRQHLPPGFRSQQHVERFGRGDDDMRRRAAHAVALRRRRVAGAHPGADVDIGEPLRGKRLADAGERRHEIFLHVVGERLQRRDVDDLRLVRQAAGQALAHQRIDGSEKGGERLARAGGRGDQHMFARLDRGPSLGLRRRRRREAASEPGGDRWVEDRGWVQRATWESATVRK